MRIFAIVLLVALLLVQYRLWFSDSGVSELGRLERSVATQQQENAELKARNAQLAAEVLDLKQGMAAVEERARSDLGMIGANESFYQVVPPDPAGATPSAPTSPPSQQASAR